MSHYQHFTSYERERVEIRLNDGWSYQKIADDLHKAKSTVCREINRFPRGAYTAEKADNQYHTLRKHCHQTRILVANTKLRDAVVKHIIDDQWSPQEFVGRLVAEGHQIKLSYQTIYREIYRTNLGIPKPSGQRGLPRKLRHKGKSRHGKNYNERRGQIQITHPIEERPELANRRMRFGDWEADTVVGKTGGQVLVTLVDRKSRFLLCARALSKAAHDVMDTMRSLLNKLPDERRLTMTPDRGKEFSKCADIQDTYNMDVYFPDAHSPWQRGSNENTNGLLREYFPKSHEIANYSDQQIFEAVNKLNMRPRKTLGYRTAIEIFFNESFHLA